MDIEALSEIGFTETHLRQIIQQGQLAADIVQTSIYAFAFDLKHNAKQKTLKTAPLNYFMGILRHGQPYAPPSNYESPQEAAMRCYVQRQAELAQKKQALEKNAAEYAFQEWLNGLTEVEKAAVLPVSFRHFKADQPKLALLKEHFMNEVWEKKQQAILDGLD